MMYAKVMDHNTKKQMIEDGKKPVHGEALTRQLTPDELAEVIEKYGSPLKPIKNHKKLTHETKEKILCSVEECTEFSRSKGMCQRHYDKFRMYGDPLFSKIVN